MLGRWNESYLRLGRRPRGDAVEPGGDVRVGGVERLADRGRKSGEAIEQDVGQRETFAAQIVASVRHLLVQPLQAMRRDLLQARRPRARRRRVSRKTSSLRRSGSR